MNNNETNKTIRFTLRMSNRDYIALLNCAKKAKMTPSELLRHILRIHAIEKHLYEDEF